MAEQSSSYTDKLISDWATRHGFLLLKEEEYPHRRYFYFSSEKGETFQFVIEPFFEENHRLDAHLIETFTDDSVHFIWNFTGNRIISIMNIAIESAKFWFSREL